MAGQRPGDADRDARKRAAGEVSVPSGSGEAAAGLSVTDRGRPRTSRALLRRVVQATLEYAGRQTLPVSLLLTDDAEIARIHGEFLDDPTPTDVISFDLDGTAEIVISTETAARMADLHGHSCADEVALYVVHGLLHLCGYDDIDAEDRQRMRQAEREVLVALGIEVADADS